MRARSIISIVVLLSPLGALPSNATPEAQALAARITAQHYCTNAKARAANGQEYVSTTCVYDYMGLKLSLTLKTPDAPAEFNVNAVPASKLSLHFIAGDPAASCYAEVNEWHHRPGQPVSVVTVYVDSRTGDVFPLGDQPGCTAR